MKALLRYLGVFFLIFGLAGGGGYVFITLFTQSAKQVVLPELKGKDIIYVLETLTGLGLNSKLLGSQYHKTIPEYSITFQDPGPGSLIKKGRDVMIYISKGPESVTVPDLRQMSLEQAVLNLERNGLVQGSLSFVHASDTIEGHVLAQFPLPFSKTIKLKACALLISKGPPKTVLVMPDFKGMAVDQTLDLLQKMNLSPSAIESRHSPHSPPGIILSQSPEPGAPVARDSKIRLFASLDRQGLKLNPDRLKGVIRVSHPLPMGFLKRHVRVELTMHNTRFDLFNEYFKPGTTINVLIPAGIKTKINIFVDHELVRTKVSDPWETEPRETLWPYTGVDYPSRHTITGEPIWD